MSPSMPIALEIGVTALSWASAAIAEVDVLARAPEAAVEHHHRRRAVVEADLLEVVDLAAHVQVAAVEARVLEEHDVTGRLRRRDRRRRQVAAHRARRRRLVAEAVRRRGRSSFHGTSTRRSGAAESRHPGRAHAFSPSTITEEARSLKLNSRKSGRGLRRRDVGRQMKLSWPNSVMMALERRPGRDQGEDAWDLGSHGSPPIVR